jgi:hypothetical protein
VERISLSNQGSFCQAGIEGWVIVARNADDGGSPKWMIRKPVDVARLTTARIRRFVRQLSKDILLESGVERNEIPENP